MNFQLIGELIRLRYKLLWARTRSRNGRIALFFVGYLIFVLVVVLLGAGGLGAGIAAVRLGKAQMLAQAVLASLFLQTLLATVIMGFGMNAMFSETELRRYPLTALERRLTRHLIGIIDPFWFLSLALEIGLVLGLYGMGAGSLVPGLVAVLLLFISNYLCARVLGGFFDRLMQSRGGSGVMTALILVLAIGAGQIPLLLHNHPALAGMSLRVLRYTPPFGAAAAITGSALEAASGIGVVLLWLAALAVALVALERQPPYRQKAETTALSFDSPYDRVAAWFGAENAPLVACWLRFYGRNNRFRTLTLLSLPLLAFLTYNFGRPRVGFGSLFLAALGTFPIAGFLGPARFTVNQFGYTGGAFRRYFLLPTDSAAALRTGNYASMLLSAPMIPLAGVAWAVFAPGPSDSRKLVMLVASGITGLLFFHALGLWASIIGPRRGNYNQSLGNDLSLVGNLVVIGGVMGCLFGPLVLKALLPALVSPDNWWLALAPPLLALVFYRVSLNGAGQLFRQRHERLMAVVEGRD